MVHRVDEGQVLDAEEEARGALGNRLIANACLIDFDFGFRGDLLLLVDLDRDNGGVGQHVDTCFVTKNISRLLKGLQDGLFNLRQLFLIISSIDDQLFFLLLQIRILLLHNNSEQLISKSLKSDHKVENGHFGRYFWQVMRVTQLRRQVEPEVHVVLNNAVTNLDVV